MIRAPAPGRARRRRHSRGSAPRAPAAAPNPKRGCGRGRRAGRSAIPAAARPRARSRQDLHLAELVGDRLAWPGDVAVDLVGELQLRQGGIVAQISERPLAAPAIGVDAGVDDEPRRAPHLVGQAAEILIGRPVDAHQRAEPFDVEAPALAIAGEIGLLAEFGPVSVPPAPARAWKLCPGVHSCSASAGRL